MKQCGRGPDRTPWTWQNPVPPREPWGSATARTVPSLSKPDRADGRAGLSAKRGGTDPTSAGTEAKIEEG
jgi:hypothetical protein